MAISNSTLLEPVQVVDSTRDVIDDFGGGASAVTIGSKRPIRALQFVDSNGNIIDSFTGAGTGPAIGDITGLGTGVATALAINVGSAGAPVVQNGVGGTPSSMTGTNITGIPESGVTSLTTDLAAKAPLASPTFTGTVTLPSGQALVAPALGTPASGVLTNCTGTASGLTAGTASAVAVGGITGLGTGVGTALAVNVGSAGAPVVLNGAGGTPSSLTGTNITGIPESGVTSLVSDLSAKAPLASPTFTGTVTLPNSQALVTPVLGTPTSGTLTNCTGLPESGVTNLVSDLSAKAPLASPTFTGTVTLPNSQALVTPVLGTPTSGTLTNCTGLPESGVTNLTSDLSAKAPLASPTFTGTVVLPSGQALVAPALGTPASGVLTNCTGTAASLTAGTVTTNANLTGDVTSSGNAATLANVPVAATHATAVQTLPTNTGGWTTYFVTGSNVNITTTTGTGDVVTGLTTGALANATKYDFDVKLDVTNAADANGMKVTINGGGSGSTLLAALQVTGTAATLVNATLNTIDTLSAAFVTASSINGIVLINGWFKTGATSAVVNVKCAKVTGNTGLVNIGSKFRVRKAYT